MSGLTPQGVAPMLRATSIVKNFGGVRALKGVDFEVLPGEVHALVGANGAGKSTLIKIIAGATSADSGTITLSDTPLPGGSTEAAMDAGISTVYQEPHLFGELTVAENIFLGRELKKGGRIDWSAQERQVTELLGRIGLDPTMADVRVADLPIGEQQLISIAKAFSHKVKVLILDEPSAILTENEIERLFAVVRSMRDDGVGVIYISHRLDELEQITDRVTIMRDGEVVTTRPTTELTIREIAELMVGRAVGEESLQRPEPAGQFALKASGLSQRRGLSDVDIAVRKGEILGVFGLIGSGTAELARTLFGITPPLTGSVEVDGKKVQVASAAKAAAAGIAMLPGNRQSEGVFFDKSLTFNVSAAHLRYFSKAGFWLDRARARATTKDLMKRLEVKAPNPETEIGNLSGGNQQKVVIARQLVEQPAVLVLEEPTQGVDVGAKEEIHDLIVKLADAGTAVIVISTDLTEITHLADTVVVMRAGSVAGRFERGAKSAAMLACAAGEAKGAPAAETKGGAS